MPASGAVTKVFALHTFHAENSDELSFEHGEYITVLEKDDQFGDGWWKGMNEAGEEGLFPASYILPEGADSAPYLEMQMAPGPLNLGGKSSNAAVGAGSVAGAEASSGKGVNGVAQSKDNGNSAAIAEAVPTGTNNKTEMNGSRRSKSPERRLSSENMDTNRSSDLSASVAGAHAVTIAENSSVPGSGSGAHATMDHTIGDVQNAIDTLGRSKTRDTFDSSVDDHVQHGDRGSASASGAAAAAAPVDEAGGRDLRSRLAEQARLENERQELDERRDTMTFGPGGVLGDEISSDSIAAGAVGVGATNGFRGKHKSTSSFGGGLSGLRMSGGVPAGLVYSDESDSEDEDTNSKMGGTGAGTPKRRSKHLESTREEEEGEGDVGESPVKLSSGAKGVFGVRNQTNSPKLDGIIPVKEEDEEEKEHERSAEEGGVQNLPPINTADMALGQGAPDQTVSTNSNTDSINQSSNFSLLAAPELGPPKNLSATGRGSSVDGSPLGSPREPTSRSISSSGFNINNQQQNQSQSPNTDNTEFGLAFSSPPSASAAGERNAFAPQFQNTSHRSLGGFPNAMNGDRSPAMESSPAATPGVTNESGNRPLASPSFGTPRSTNVVVSSAAPSLWTVEEVVSWARSRGFEEIICQKFEEHEISGDILLDLDANLLKELEIPQFGKRVKIANAIAELRQPILNSNANSQFQQGYLPHSTPGSRSATNIAPIPESSPVSQPHPIPSSNPTTPAYQTAKEPSSYISITPNQQPTTAEPALGERESGAAGLGLGAISPQPSSAPPGSRDTGFAPGSGAASLAYAEWARSSSKESEAKVHQHITPEPPLAPTLEITPQPSRSDGNFVITNGNVNGNNYTNGAPSAAESLRSRSSTIPNSPTTSNTNTKRSSQDRSSLTHTNTHKRGKASIDGGKAPSERMSFFGGGLGRTRKPAPRYPSSASAMASDRDIRTNSPTSPISAGSLGHERALSLSRLMGGNSQRDSSNRVSKQSAPPQSQMLAKAPSSPAGSAATSGNPRPVSTGAAAAAAAATATAAPESAVAKIGKPDYTGYMKKKGDRYNSWKMRYFVLKGAHLYYLRNENEPKVKGHIDLHGYKVLSDGNANAGSYGFQIVHERDKTHYFSSTDHRVVKEWMKQLMKATITRDYNAPVVSSCNIPTIPLREAQMLAPRPPSPNQRAATQRANRRENPNALTPRDASVLMSLDASPSSPRRLSMGGQQTQSNVTTPSRPNRDMRRPSQGRDVRLGSVSVVFYSPLSFPS